MSTNPNTILLRKRKPGGGRKPADLTNVLGKQYGRLTIVSSAPRASDRDRDTRVECKCSCGNERNTIVRLQDVLTGHVASCGCRKREVFNRYQDVKATNLSSATCRAIFHAVRKPGQNAAKIAKEQQVNKYVIQAAVRRHKNDLRAKFGERFANSFRPGFAPTEEKPSLYEFRWLRKYTKYNWPESAPLEIEWSDLDPFQQEYFDLYAEYSEVA